MATKFLLCTLLITFAFAHGRDTNIRPNNVMVKAERESRLIDIPLIGALFFLGSQVVGLVMSAIWSMMEFKLAALSLVSGVVTWMVQNYMVVIVGAVVIAGFCLATSVYSSEPVYEIEHLARAVRNVDSNVVKYARFV